MENDHYQEHINDLLNDAARLPKSMTSEIREELALYGYTREAIEQYRQQQGIEIPTESQIPDTSYERKAIRRRRINTAHRLKSRSIVC